MATFNTAFGSLPNYNDAMGKSNTTAGGLDQYSQPDDEEAKRKKAQQQQQQQQQQQVQQPRPQTFAEMQKGGQARPAPPPPPMAQAGGMQPMQLHQDLQNRLKTGWPSAAPEAAPQPNAAGGMQEVNAAMQSVSPSLSAQSPQESEMIRQEKAAYAPPPLPDYAEQQNGLLTELQAQLGTPQEQQQAMSPPQPEVGIEAAPGMALPPEPAVSAPVAPAPAPVPAPASTPAPAPAPSPAAASAAVAPASSGLPAQVAAALGVPSPATAAPVATDGTSQSSQLMSQLQQQLGLLSSAPSPYQDPAFQASRDAAVANLQAQYSGEKTALNEEMARRGLSASSIASGKMGDLAGQQARALATMQGDLLKEQATTAAANRNVLLQGLQGAAATSGDIEMRAKALQQEAALQGRTLDLTQARDMAQREYQQGQLNISQQEVGLKGQELAQQNQQYQSTLAETRALRLQNMGISQQEIDLKAQQIQNDAKNQGRTLDLQQARDLAEVDYRAKDLMQRDKALTMEDARAKVTQDIQRENIAQTAKDNALDRALREKLGVSTAELDARRVAVGEGEFKVSLLKFLADAGMTPDVENELRKKYGLPLVSTGPAVGTVNNGPTSGEITGNNTFGGF